MKKNIFEKLMASGPMLPPQFTDADLPAFRHAQQPVAQKKIKTPGKKGGEPSINLMIFKLKEKVFADNTVGDFTDSFKWSRLYGKNLVDLEKKLSPHIFWYRIDCLLADDFHRENMRALRYIFNLVKTFDPSGDPCLDEELYRLLHQFYHIPAPKADVSWIDPKHLDHLTSAQYRRYKAVINGFGDICTSLLEKYLPSKDITTEWYFKYSFHYALFNQEQYDAGIRNRDGEDITAKREFMAKAKPEYFPVLEKMIAEKDKLMEMFFYTHPDLLTEFPK
jgi:hypothetical protein